MRRRGADRVCCIHLDEALEAPRQKEGQSVSMRRCQKPQEVDEFMWSGVLCRRDCVILWTRTRTRRAHALAYMYACMPIWDLHA